MNQKKYPAKEILMLVKRARRKKLSHIEVDGIKAKMSLETFINFHKHGTVCKNCGLEGAFCYLNKNRQSKYHMIQLYGVDHNGVEMLLTKDHIVPVAKGGTNSMDNFQTLCKMCNWVKLTFENEDMEKINTFYLKLRNESTNTLKLNINNFHYLIRRSNKKNRKLLVHKRNILIELLDMNNKKDQNFKAFLSSKLITN